MISLPRRALTPRFCTKYLNYQNTSHVITRVQPQTLKYLNENSILGHKSILMSPDAFLGLRSRYNLCIYFLIIVCLVVFNAAINMEGWKLSWGYPT